MTVDATHLISLFENATEGIILTNYKGEIILVNPAAEKMFEYDAGEIIGDLIEVLIPDRYKPDHGNLRSGFNKNPSNRVMGHNRDLHGRRKNGSEVAVEVSLSHYHRDGEMFIIVFIVDITKRKEIENDMLQQKKQVEKISNEIRKLNMVLEAKVEERTVILKEALQKLEQSQIELSEALDKERQLNEIKSRFVSMASHEFRTPLSTVLSSASLLSRYTGTGDQEKRNRHIEKIKGSVKHLNDILEDFLSLGRLDEEKVEANSGNFDLKEFIADALEEMKGLLKTGQHFVFDYQGNTTVYSDKKLLKNIFLNLITNAIKFSNEDKPISITGKRVNDLVRIDIEDKGIGIGTEDQEHLFSSFFRGSNAINIQGTGLGLHIVKRYIDLLGGDVYLQSELNKGTTVSFTIPTN